VKEIEVMMVSSIASPHSLCFWLLCLTGVCIAQPAASTSSSGDGIPDTWKTNGVTFTYPDGTKGQYNLKSLGAVVGQKDIFVFIAWMDAQDHSHKPNPAALERVRKAFLNSPVTDPNKSTGIALHVVYAPKSVPETTILGSTDSTGNYVWTAFDAIKSKVMPAQLRNVFFFCLFAHDIDIEQHSGITKSMPGRDFIVSLGGFDGAVGSEAQQTGTFMHELGHALGLHHGGSDDINFKPNYVSIMNYSFQLAGLSIGGENAINSTNWHFDYSRFQLDADESHLSETRGLSTDPTLALYGTQYFCASSPSVSLTLDSIVQNNVDLNCDGVYSDDVAADINGDQKVGKLPGWDDWDHIVLATPTSAAGIAPVIRLRPQDELTPSLADRVSILPVTGVAARVVDKNVVLAWNAMQTSRLVGYRVYRESEGKKEVIATTRENALVDTVASRGALSYSVVAIIEPLSKSQQEVAKLAAEVEAAQDRYDKAIKGSAEPNVSTIFKLPDTHALAEAITSSGAGAPPPRVQSPTPSAGVRTPAQIPSLLLQTAPSKSVKIDIQ
jgi:hypothetical protein